MEANPQTNEVTSENTASAGSVGGEGDATQVTGTTSGGEGAEYTLAINGTQIIDKQDVETNTLTAEDAAAKINNHSGDTNVTASVTDGGKLELSAEEGRTIKVQEIGSTTGGGTGGAINGFFGEVALTGGNTTVGATDEFRGTVELSADTSITVTDNNNGGTAGGSSEIQEFGGTTFTSGGDASGTASTNQLSAQNVLDQENARDAIRSIDSAISDVDSFRGSLGASQNRFENTINNLETSNTALTESRSRIQDADIAQQAAEQTQNNIRRQAASSVLAQANQNQQIALQLLGG